MDKVCPCSPYGWDKSIPSIGLTTALKDLLVDDSIVGLLRTIEACITALAIAAGYFAVAFLTGGAI